MALLVDSKFSGSTLLTDTHDSTQCRAGKATWVRVFKPVVKDGSKLMAEGLLWSCYNLGLCCAIVGDFAVYIVGKLASPPNLLSIYVAYPPQKLSTETAILVQKQRTSAFSYGSVDLLFMEKYSIPGSNIFYTARYGGKTAPVRFFCVDCLETCGPRSSLDFVNCLWTTFAYYCTNFAMVVLPSQTSGNKLIYMRHYKAEIEGDESRVCSECLWRIPDIRLKYDTECRRPDQCTCTLCLKQPLSLKSAASEIVFRLVYSVDKFCFDQDTTYQQYTYAVRYGVTLSVEQLVPSTSLPCVLTFQFIFYDDASLRQYHEHCASAVDVRNGTRWMDSLRYQLERPADFVGSVARLKSIFWCAHCEKALF